MMYIILLLMVAFLVLIERKILSLSQMRKSPNIVGFFSVFQTIMDSLKLILKNFIFMKKNEFFLFVFSPMMGFMLALMNYFFLLMVFMNYKMTYGILLNLFISGLMVYSILSSSWGSYNTYSLVGSIRAVAQMISYEVVLSFFILFFLLKFNSFSWTSLSNINFFFSSYFFFFFMLSMIIFSAELNRTPFDLVESESELISSYNVEYSSISFTFLFLAEYLNIWFYSFVLVMLFISKMFVFMVFLMSLMFCWVRAILPRYKFMDLIILMWKYLLPFLTFMYVFLIYM